MKTKLSLLALLISVATLFPFSLHSQCDIPQSIIVAEITQTSATLYWDGEFEEGWYVIISNSIIHNPDTNDAVRVSNNMFEAPGLTPQTTYYYNIATICADTISSWVAGNFMTKCLATGTPYSEPFEVYGTGGNAFPSCWTKVQSSYNNYPYITSINSSMGSLVFKNSTCIAAIQAMTEDISTLRVSFIGRSESTTAGLEIGVMNDVTNASDFVAIDTVYVSTVNTFESFEVHCNNYVGTGQYIAFRYTASERFYIDDVVVSPIPTCLNPVSLSVSNITMNGATIRWTEVGNPSGCQALISTTPITNFAGHTPFTVSNQQYAPTTLSPSTTYYFYVQSVCNDEVSDWSSISFTTLCNATLIPVSEEFPNLSLPTCWSTQYVTGNSAITFSDFGNNPSTAPANGYAMVAWNSLNFPTGAQSRLVSLPISTMAQNGVEVSFAWRHSTLAPEALTEGLQLQYSFDGTNWTNTADGLIRRYSDVYDNWTNYSITIPEVANRSRVYIGFLFTSARGANCYLDEIGLNTVSSCYKPVVNPASQIEGNSAVISWTEIGSATTWNVIISDTIVTNFNTTPFVTVHTNSFTATDLNFMTPYYYYVQSVCGSNNNSEWSNIQHFTTICGLIINFPYIENFDTYGTCSDAFPPCWSRPTTYSYYDFEDMTSCTTPSASEKESVSGTASLLFASPSGNYTYAVSPAISTDIHEMMVSLFLWKENATYSGSMEIGVMSNPNDMVTFEVVATLNPANAATWNYYQIFFDQTLLSGTNRYIAFRHLSSSDYNYYLMDDVTIDLIPSCWHAIHPEVAGITGNTATLSWDDNNESSHQWHLKISDYALQNLSAYGNVLDTIIHTNTFIVNYLSGGRNFYYYLQADCGNNDLSRWVSGTFETEPCNCFVKINMNDLGNNGWNGGQIDLYAGDDYIGSATLEEGASDSAMIYTCENGTIDFMWVNGNFDNEITFTIENNQGAVIYSSAGTPTAGNFFQYTNGCESTCDEIPTNLTAANYNGGATLEWEGTPGATSYSVYKNGNRIAAWIPNTAFIDATTVSGEVCYTVTAVCVTGESSESNSSCITGITEYSSLNWQIFPNPAQTQFEILAEQTITEVMISNTLGQIIQQLSINDTHTTIHTDHWQNGLYFIKAKVGEQWLVSRIMIIR